jgi:hypothetical protein
MILLTEDERTRNRINKNVKTDGGITSMIKRNRRDNVMTG